MSFYLYTVIYNYLLFVRTTSNKNMFPRPWTDVLSTPWKWSHREIVHWIVEWIYFVTLSMFASLMVLQLVVSALWTRKPFKHHYTMWTLWNHRWKYIFLLWLLTWNLDISKRTALHSIIWTRPSCQSSSEKYCLQL